MKFYHIDWCTTGAGFGVLFGSGDGFVGFGFLLGRAIVQVGYFPATKRAK